MVFKTTGNKSNSVILFFHAMGVTGESSMPVAEKMAEKYYCIMPTSTVYCSGQRYQSKRDEIQQIVRFLGNHGIKEIELIVASSIGADLAMAFLTEIKIPVKHVFFDGGQFAQIGKASTGTATVTESTNTTDKKQKADENQDAAKQLLVDLTGSY